MNISKVIFTLLIACSNSHIKSASYNIISTTPPHDAWQADLEAHRLTPPPVDLYASNESLPDRTDYPTTQIRTVERCPKVNWCTTAKYAIGTATILGATAGLTYFASWLGPDLANIAHNLPAIRESLAVLTAQEQVLINTTEEILKIVSKF